MRLALLILALFAAPCSADTFVNGERYEPGQSVDPVPVVFADAGDCTQAVSRSAYGEWAYVNGKWVLVPVVHSASAGACSQAASACSSQQSASACGSSASAKSARTGPVRRLFGRLFRGRSSCGG